MARQTKTKTKRDRKGGREREGAVIGRDERGNCLSPCHFLIVFRESNHRRRREECYLSEELEEESLRMDVGAADAKETGRA